MKVAVFSTNFLDYSQTFVYEEITHHERYAVEVFCRARKLQDRFPFAPVHVGGPVYGVTRESLPFHRAFRRGGFDLIHGHFGTGSLYAVHMASAYAAFAILGAAVLAAGWLPVWVGWLGVGWGLVFLAGFVVTRFAGPFNPPFWAHTYTALVGAMLLAS
jgi:hypothetical protein